MGEQACGELKIPKSIHSISVCQNGRFVLPSRITTGGGLHVHAVYEK